MTSVSPKHSTRMAIPVFADQVESLRAMVIDAVDVGATLIELRLDLMWAIDDEDLRLAIQGFPADVRFVLTCRATLEGGETDVSDRERLERMAGLADVVDFLDVELATWRIAENREILQSSLGVLSTSRDVKDTGTTGTGPRKGLVLSVHDYHGRPRSMTSDLIACAEDPACTVIKLVWLPRSVRDCFEAFELMRTAPKPIMAMCLGELGVISRLLAPKFGAFASFFSLGQSYQSAPGQIPAKVGATKYRWREIQSDTRVFGVIGHPVSHSISPEVHNGVFSVEDTNALYLPFDVAPGYEAFKALMVEVAARPWLDVGGLSVTAPHKEHAFRYLSENGGVIDDLTKRIGAVNTISVQAGQPWSGTNTDAGGAWSAIEESVGKDKVIHQIKRALVLGAGGVARAIVADLMERRIAVTISNRTIERAENLAREFGADVCEWTQRGEQEFDLLVNCTSIGQTPNESECPWPGKSIPNGAIVFDTVYSPQKTKLLTLAEQSGSRTVAGSAMFTGQAAAQWEFWMGRPANLSEYQLRVESALREKP